MGRKFGHDKQYLKISYRHEPLRLIYQSLENVFIFVYKYEWKDWGVFYVHKWKTSQDQ